MLRRAAATASNGALRRPVTSTRAPFWAKASTAERPMPELPPVMITTWFSYGLIVPPRRCRRKASANAVREWALRSFEAFPKRPNIGADARGVHPIITSPLAAGRAHVDAASGHVTGDPDYDVIREPEPAALLTCLDVARIGIGGNDGPALPHCGLFVRDRETSVRIGLRGGPQRTRTGCQAPSHIEPVSETSQTAR